MKVASDTNKLAVMLPILLTTFANLIKNPITTANSQFQDLQHIS